MFQIGYQLPTLAVGNSAIIGGGGTFPFHIAHSGIAVAEAIFGNGLGWMDVIGLCQCNCPFF